MAVSYPKPGDVVYFKPEKEIYLRCLSDGGQFHTEPFPFVKYQVDGWDKLKLAESEFPSIAKWNEFSSPWENKKSQVLAPNFIPPTCRKLIDYFNSPGLIESLGLLFGYPNLIPDPTMRGGGLHETKSGGFLGIHTDFNVHPVLQATRRLNLILFLNSNWQESWGGELELWDESGPVFKIAPTMGTLVVFETSGTSWHGHPNPLRCPEGVTRKSIALYYYTPGIEESTRETKWRDKTA